MEFLQRESAGVRVHAVPLPATVEPHGIGVAQRLDELFGVATFGSAVCSMFTCVSPALEPGLASTSSSL